VQIILIAALTENRVLGKDNQLIWRLPKDLQNFKKVTLGYPVVMGRKTHGSLGKPLPGRTNIIITHQTGYQADGCLVAHSLDEALVQAANTGADKVFIIGGGDIYRQALPLAHAMCLTYVHTTLAGDAFFPEFPEDEWQQTSKESFLKDEKHAYAFDITVWQRRLPQAHRFNIGLT